MSDVNGDAIRLFADAAIIDDVKSRREFLDKQCHNPKVRQIVDELFDASEQADSFLEQPVLRQGCVAETAATSIGLLGTNIGPYKLLQKIGEGGFGSVYMAQQQNPIKRRVALKVIKPGMDSCEVIARFEAERQALALMDHPNIAKVLDAGATSQGHPYFAMELVNGVPVTDFCNEAKLPLQGRLEIFVTVCKAVQHAHQKGVIHRDIKPSNVLVTLHGEEPVPIVIDFGVAKAMSQPLTDKTFFTQFGQMVGTPQYMSPEQSGISGLDVDTRSDIYSLGVLLYELITGTLPLDSRRLRSAAFAEIAKIIQEEEPPRPSMRVSTLGDRLPITNYLQPTWNRPEAAFSFHSWRS